MKKDSAAEANQLYWQTDTSVGDIAEKLDLSRRALYDALEPIPAETTCPVCGGTMHYINRSARDSHQGTCYTCATSSPQQAPPIESEPWTWSPSGAANDNDSRERVRDRDYIAARARRLGAAALLGAVIGAGITHVLLRRD